MAGTADRRGRLRPPGGHAGRGRRRGSLVWRDDLRPGADAAIMPLAGPGLLATAVGADIRAVRAALDLLGTDPPAPLAAAAV